MEGGPLSPHFLPAIICVNIMNHKQKYLPQENIESKTYICIPALLQSKHEATFARDFLLHEACIVHFTANQNNYSCYLLQHARKCFLCVVNYDLYKGKEGRCGDSSSNNQIIVCT